MFKLEILIDLSLKILFQDDKDDKYVIWHSKQIFNPNLLSFIFMKFLYYLIAEFHKFVLGNILKVIQHYMY